MYLWGIAAQSWGTIQKSTFFTELKRLVKQSLNACSGNAINDQMTANHHAIDNWELLSSRSSLGHIWKSMIAPKNAPSRSTI